MIDLSKTLTYVWLKESAEPIPQLLSSHLVCGTVTIAYCIWYFLQSLHRGMAEDANDKEQPDE